MPINYVKEKQEIQEEFSRLFGATFDDYKGNVRMKMKFFFKMPNTFKGFTGKKAEIAREMFDGKYADNNKDIDNLQKTIMDSLLEYAYYDDRQVIEVESSKYWTNEESRTEVEIEYIGLESLNDVDFYYDKQQEEIKNEINRIHSLSKPNVAKKQ